ncbi:MAG: D-alanyl-D-alanine carboxypeptidase [Clostridia bacterium]|nr:D-alanyl-D-alanine carboxypeptidase [Clostridia bacterium]
MYNQYGVIAQGDTSAKAACIMEMQTGRVLFAYNMHQKLPMASTTKVMTALLAIERGDLASPVVCSENAFGVPGTSIYLAQGETLTLREMLLGLMLSSGNDAAVAIAEHIGGSTVQFAQMMNERARAAGAVNTHFTNPHGLPDDRHLTTAYDLALIAREAMGNETFRSIVSTQRAAIPWEGRAYPRQLTNKNRLLSDYPGATGIKTGYTSRAGRCLVFGAQRGGMELVGVVLGCQDWFAEAARLMDGCYDTYSMTDVLGPMQSAGEMPVTDGRESCVGMCLMEPLSVPLAQGEAAQIVLDVPQSVAAPVYPGMHLGTASLVVGGSVLGLSEVVASGRVDSSGLLVDVRRVMAGWPLP